MPEEETDPTLAPNEMDDEQLEDLIAAAESELEESAAAESE